MTLSTSGITQMFNDLDLSGPLTDIVSGISGQVTNLLPIGLGIVLVLAVPRVVKTIIRSFI